MIEGDELAPAQYINDCISEISNELENKRKIVWQPWKKKFAFKPTKLSNGEKIWGRTYYERKGRNQFIEFTDRGTLFDILGKE